MYIQYGCSKENQADNFLHWQISTTLTVKMLALKINPSCELPSDKKTTRNETKHNETFTSHHNQINISDRRQINK